MKPKTRLLVGLAITSLITLVAAIAILRPSVLLAAALTLCSVLAVLAAQRFLADIIPSRPVPPSSVLSTSRGWPQRTGDPDKLVDRLVSSMEDFITNIRENKDSPDNANVRQGLHRCLGSIVEQTTGLPVGSRLRGNRCAL